MTSPSQPGRGPGRPTGQCPPTLGSGHWGPHSEQGGRSQAAHVLSCASCTCKGRGCPPGACRMGRGKTGVCRGGTGGWAGPVRVGGAGMSRRDAPALWERGAGAGADWRALEAGKVGGGGVVRGAGVSRGRSAGLSDGEARGPAGGGREAVGRSPGSAGAEQSERGGRRRPCPACRGRGQWVG